MKKNHKRLIAAALCLCMAGGIPAAGYSPVMPNTACAEDAVNPSVVYLAVVGDETTLSLAGTTEIPKWKSDDESIATVKSNGDLSATVKATGKGTTSVYAVLSKQTIRFDVTVLRATKDELIPVDGGTIKLTKANPKAQASLDIPQDTEVFWKTSDQAVAIVDSRGIITAAGKGTCIVTAVCAGYAYNITVVSDYTPPEPVKNEEICIGDIVLTNEARGQKISFPEDTKVKFWSTDESVATVSEDGVIVAMGEGECRVYAQMEGNTSYVNVKSTYVKPTGELGTVTLTLSAPSQKLDLTVPADTKTITWSSSDPAVAVVNSTGFVVAVNKGECVITADIDGEKYNVDVIVDLKDGETFDVTELRGTGSKLTIDPKDMGKDPKYASTDTSVVTVDEKGVVTAVGEGFAVIIAESETALSYLRVRVVKAGMIGDANCDGVVSIADATSIMQHIGNMDKYRLTDEGIINGDVDGQKGLSGTDALVLQMFDAKLITTLPHKLDK